MTKKDGDVLLTKLSKFATEVADDFHKSEDHAVFMIGVKLIDEPETETQGVHTFINVNGYYEILAEGLYAELKDELSNGNATLFSIIRDVVRDLEEDFDIDPDEEIEEDNAPENYH